MTVTRNPVVSTTVDAGRLLGCYSGGSGDLEQIPVMLKARSGPAVAVTGTCRQQLLRQVSCAPVASLAVSLVTCFHHGDCVSFGALLLSEHVFDFIISNLPGPAQGSCSDMK